VRTEDTDLASLPEDNETLKAMLRSLLLERDQQTKRAKDLHVENLRLQVERYRKLYYGPRADRLRSTGDLAQVLLDFAEELEHKSIHADDVPQQVQPEYELRRVKRRKGRRALANFENLPVTTKVYELSAEERACPRGRVSRFRGPHSRSGAAMWPIWSSRCISEWRRGCGSRIW
jgi:hypothetical protein